MPLPAMLTGIDCLWMINVSFVPGSGIFKMGAELPPSDPPGTGAAGRPPVLSDPLWQQSHGLCKPVSQGRAFRSF